MPKDVLELRFLTLFACFRSRRFISAVRAYENAKVVRLLVWFVTKRWDNFRSNRRSGSA